ncbi:DUF2599 domain-containing protein [Pseudomonas sp. Irchel 3E13]|uniref:DUF2599 domain-containing protein n=1 Tax=Pseudomonas sp. Irchel 3E13 TaxID=2008975 RepID=UPI000BA3BE50|nr:DUF2599 domain-containing protein [Pseudomonas sp. Irchel 3E13]
MRKTVEKIAPLLICPLLFGVPLANAETCEETLKVVQELYNNTVDKCGDDPASDCSGLLIRGTHRADPAKGQAWDVWNPSPRAQELQSEAFSYMRKDIKYDNPGMQTQNGYITTPFDLLCQGKQGGHLQCAFPNDAWTDMRTDKGCRDSQPRGNSPGSKEIEGTCKEMGVNSGAQWLAHFNKYNNQTYQDIYQCGFDMRKGVSRADRTTAFKNFLDARKLINNREFQTQTELRLSLTEPNERAVLAFFTSDSRGDAAARLNQQDYLKKTGNYRPIINIKFPLHASDVATFSCAANQMAPPANSASPGFCRTGKPPSPGFGPGTGSGPTQTPAQAQASQAAAAAAAAALADANLAESKYCTPYFTKSEWISRDDPVFGPNTLSLSLTTNPTCSIKKLNEVGWERMYAELYEKHKNDPQWKQYANNGGSMREQFYCHVVGYPGKEVMNLEPVRPMVPYKDSLKLPSPCNPGK